MNSELYINENIGVVKLDTEVLFNDEFIKDLANDVLSFFNEKISKKDKINKAKTIIIKVFSNFAQANNMMLSKELNEYFDFDEIADDKDNNGAYSSIEDKIFFNKPKFEEYILNNKLVEFLITTIHESEHMVQSRFFKFANLNDTDYNYFFNFGTSGEKVMKQMTNRYIFNFLNNIKESTLFDDRIQEAVTMTFDNEKMPETMKKLITEQIYELKKPFNIKKTEHLLKTSLYNDCEIEKDAHYVGVVLTEKLIEALANQLSDLNFDLIDKLKKADDLPEKHKKTIIELYKSISSEQNFKEFIKVLSVNELYALLVAITNIDIRDFKNKVEKTGNDFSLYTHYKNITELSRILVNIYCERMTISEREKTIKTIFDKAKSQNKLKIIMALNFSLNEKEIPELIDNLFKNNMSEWLMVREDLFMKLNESQHKKLASDLLKFEDISLITSLNKKLTQIKRQSELLPGFLYPHKTIAKFASKKNKEFIPDYLEATTKFLKEYFATLRMSMVLQIASKGVLSTSFVQLQKLLTSTDGFVGQDEETFKLLLKMHGELRKALQVLDPGGGPNKN